MKQIIKGTKNSVFTPNRSINIKDFKEDVFIKNTNFYSNKYVGNFGNTENEYCDVILFNKIVHKSIKNLYQIKIIKPGDLQYKHLAYVIINKYISYGIYFREIINNIDNWFKLLTIIVALATCYNAYKKSITIINNYPINNIIKIDSNLINEFYTKNKR